MSTVVADRITRIGAGIACWIAALVLYVVAVRTRPGRELDARWFGTLRDELAGRSWIPDGAGLARNQLVLLVIGLGVVCATCLVNRFRPRTTIVSLCVGIGPGFAAAVLKGLLTRPATGWELTAHNSFPSGTVAGFAGMAAALTYVARTRLQYVIACAAWGTTGLVSLIVIRAHWHRPSDVAGSVLIAVGALAVASGISSLQQRSVALVPRPPAVPPRPLPQPTMRR